MGHVRSKTRSPGQIIISDLNPQVSPVVYKAMKKGNSKKSSLSGERSRALWALLFIIILEGLKHNNTPTHITIMKQFSE